MTESLKEESGATESGREVKKKRQNSMDPVGVGVEKICKKQKGYEEKLPCMQEVENEKEEFKLCCYVLCV